MITLKTTLNLEAGIVIVQKPFIDNQEICYSRLNLYLSQRERKNIRVMIGVRKDLLDKFLVDHRTDLINHLYIILLEIHEFDPQSIKPEKKTQVVNVYEN